MPGRRDALVRLIYRAGWRGASRIPPGVAAAAIRLGSAAALLHNGQHVQTLRTNLSYATGEPAGQPLVRAGLASYLRTFFEVLVLPGWSPADVLAHVVTRGEETLRRAYAGAGAVVALPHSANWDLAGAWACLTSMPVTTVAEQLPEAEFAAFVAFREELGMRVLSHADPNTTAALVRDARLGRLVCLVSDRDLPGRGIPVRWRDQPVTIPGGPALVARLSGAALVPAVCAYTPTGMQITFGAEVGHRPGREGLQAMTQDVATFFAEQIARQPQDWHMLQPFFERTETPS